MEELQRSVETFEARDNVCLCLWSTVFWVFNMCLRIFPMNYLFFKVANPNTNPFSAFSIAGYWHQDKCRWHRHSGIWHLSHLLEHSGTGQDPLFTVLECSRHWHFNSSYINLLARLLIHSATGPSAVQSGIPALKNIVQR
jgi:hypothetical protein